MRFFYVYLRPENNFDWIFFKTMNPMLDNNFAEHCFQIRVRHSHKKIILTDDLGHP
jgi:hypothetical protein